MEGFSTPVQLNSYVARLKLLRGSNEQHPSSRGHLPAGWKTLLPRPASTDIYHHHHHHPKTFPHSQKVGFSSHSTHFFHMTRTHAQALIEMLVEHKKQKKQSGELNWTDRTRSWRRIKLLKHRFVVFKWKASGFYVGCFVVPSKSDSKYRFPRWFGSLLVGNITFFWKKISCKLTINLSISKPNKRHKGCVQ